MRNTLVFLLLLILLAPASSQAQHTREGQATSLNGPWRFALDPMKRGEQEQWFNADFPIDAWDGVAVPHCFSVDQRYLMYTGTAWYVKRFRAPTASPGQRVFLHFDAVYYKAKIWLNGQLLGEHEGGYTPFELDATNLARAGENVLAVAVNNAWDTTTLPQAKTPDRPERHNDAQFFAWINYGGLTRSVRWVVRPSTFIQRVRIVAEPQGPRAAARVRIQASLLNASDKVVKLQKMQVAIYQGTRRLNVRFAAVPAATLAPGAPGTLAWEGTVAAADVVLWDQDHPTLYRAEVVVNTDTLRTRFGIRRWEVRGTQLLLNGEPVRMGGANRPLDYPGQGSLDPPAVLAQDLTLMKNAGMELSRINHHAVSEELLDWADEHGLLLIGEAGNWQLTPPQMADPTMRAKFQAQFREMVESQWNHPCLVAWSVGNEYDSTSPEGLSWTKDMVAFAKQLDPSRPVTFASMYVFRGGLTSGEQEGSRYVDFVSANIYDHYPLHFDRIHALYPNKPLYISEFGVRADRVSEAEQARSMVEVVDAMRARPYIVGANLWTFQDYRSMYPGTAANGYRPWGALLPSREPRELYKSLLKEFAPATLAVSSAGGKTTITVTARATLPSYVLRGYTLVVNDQQYPVKTLQPGDSQAFVIENKLGQVAPQSLSVRLKRPTGFTALEQSFPLHP